MLQTVELPACIAHLDSGLTDMDGDTLALKRELNKMSQTQILWSLYRVLDDSIHPHVASAE